MDQEYSSAAFLANLEIKPAVMLGCERQWECRVHPLIHASLKIES